jgi:Putative 2OG-Fe(II) oxygenase
MQSPELINLFSVPFARSRYPNPQALNSALKRFIHLRERTGPPNPRPLTQRNAAVFESDFNLFRSEEAAIQELKAFCWNQMLSMIAALNGYDLPTINRLNIFNDCWFHVTRRGGFFGLHNHPNASWSGVYCVDPGAQDPGQTESGQLTFVNPMLTTAMHMDAANANLQLPFSSQLATISL